MLFTQGTPSVSQMLIKQILQTSFVSRFVIIFKASNVPWHKWLKELPTANMQGNIRDENYLLLLILRHSTGLLCNLELVFQQSVKNYSKAVKPPECVFFVDN